MSIREINLETGEEVTREYTADELAAIQAAQAEAAQQEIASKLATIRQVRKEILNVLAGITLAAQLEGDTATTAAYVTVRQQLLDITSNLPADPAEVDVVVMQRYQMAVAQCTPNMVSAFAQVFA